MGENMVFSLFFPVTLVLQVAGHWSAFLGFQRQSVLGSTLHQDFNTSYILHLLIQRFCIDFGNNVISVQIGTHGPVKLRQPLVIIDKSRDLANVSLDEIVL